MNLEEFLKEKGKNIGSIIYFNSSHPSLIEEVDDFEEINDSLETLKLKILCIDGDRAMALSYDGEPWHICLKAFEYGFYLQIEDYESPHIISTNKKTISNEGENSRLKKEYIDFQKEVRDALKESMRDERSQKRLEKWFKKVTKEKNKK
jgi:hypothetical protein